MANDPIAELGTALGEDHKAEKRRRTKTPAAKPGEAAGDGASAAASTENEGGDTTATVEEDEGGRTSVIADRIENIAVDATLDTSTLAGDLRDTFLDLFKTRPKPWDAMNEDDQKQVAKALDFASKQLVQEAVLLIAEQGDGGFYATLESYKEKGGVQITLKGEPTKETILALHDSVNQKVYIRRADSQPFAGQRGDVTIQPDQRPMEFEGTTGQVEPPPADDSDLAGGEEGSSFAGDGGDDDDQFGVFGTDNSWWLIDEDGGDDGWTDSVQDAGRWKHARASELAEQFGATVRRLD